MSPIEHFEVPGHVPGLDGTDYQLVQDETSGFLHVTPIPSPEQLNDFYETYFYSERAKFNDSSKEARDRDRDYVNWGVDDFLEEYHSLTGRMPKSALDIGCGFGHALDRLATKGVQTFGFEPYMEAVKHCQASGHRVSHGLAEDLLRDEGRTFDLVIANHVLEHVRRPHELLQMVRSVMDSQSRLYVQVPNDFSSLQSAAAQAHELDPWWVSPPIHLSYFSKESLENVLGANGFQVEVMWSDFPMEMFLLMGRNYISEPALGSACHEERLAFEGALRDSDTKLVRQMYRAMAQLGIGRELHVLAKLSR